MDPCTTSFQTPPTLMGPPAPLPSCPPAHAAFCVDEQLTYLGFAEALHHLLPDVIRECALEVLLQQLSHCLIRHQWVTGLQNHHRTHSHISTHNYLCLRLPGRCLILSSRHANPPRQPEEADTHRNPGLNCVQQTLSWPHVMQQNLARCSGSR